MWRSETSVSIKHVLPLRSTPMQGGFIPNGGWAPCHDPTADFVPFAVHAVCTSASSVSEPETLTTPC